MAEAGFSPIDTLQQLDQAVANNATVVWFNGPDCQVCSDLKPKVARLLSSDFPQLARFQVDCVQHPDIAAQHLVFSVPTLLVFFTGQETLRKSRNFSSLELQSALKRPYGLLFELSDE